jgi:CDP-glucose 4,6-dehydratase
MVRNEISLDVLRGRRILLTGHTGFKGAWLALWLRALGANVVGIALPAKRPGLYDALNLDEMVDSRIADIRNQDAFDAAVDEEAFDLVIHMAAQSLVRPSYDAPVETYQTNVVGTAVVLQAARRMPTLRGAIVVTSDKCYDNRGWIWGYRESDPMGGADPYSSSKGCTELVVSAFRSSFFNAPSSPVVCSVRAGNVIGGGDWCTDRLVPDLVRSVETGRPARIRNPRSVRPWQHVLEPLRGYLMLAAAILEDRRGCDEGWNFGPGVDDTVEVGALAELAIRRWRGECPQYITERSAADPAESKILRLDSSKAAVQLGWRPLLDIESAVNMTVDWYREYTSDPARIDQFSLQQIEDYTARWNARSASSNEPFVDRKVAACV